MSSARGCVRQLAGGGYVLELSERGPPRRRPRIALGRHKSERDARLAADQWLARETGAIAIGPTVTMTEICERFLRVDAAGVRPSSRRRYTRLLRKFAIPQLGNRAASQINTAAIREHLAALADLGVSGTTLVGVRQLIVQALRSAGIDGIAAVAPIDTRRLKVPKNARPPRELLPVSAAELAAIIEASAWPWRALWSLMFYAGFRVAEALGAQWGDFDFATHRLAIARQVVDGEILLPKTGTSIAEIPMLSALEQILDAYRPHWNQNAEGFLFVSRARTVLNQENIRRRHWHPMLKRLGLPTRGVHALRHGLPGHLFGLGLSADVVQRMMRHSSLAITQRYTHVSSEALQRAIDQAIGRVGATKIAGSGDAGRSVDPSEQENAALQSCPERSENLRSKGAEGDAE